jgi:protein gp37
MGQHTSIEWTDHTFNPWRSCQHLILADGSVHPACEHCYAETMAKRFPDKLGEWGPEGTRIMAPEKMWRQVLGWNKKAEAAGQRARVFCASIADVFEDWQGPIHNSQGDMLGYSDGEFHTIVSKTPYAATMNDLRRKLFELIDATPWLDWQLLTKRPGNILKMTPPYSYHACETGDCPHSDWLECDSATARKYRDNVWLGTSVSNQQTAGELIPQLLANQGLASVLFLSAEPLLGHVNLHARPEWFWAGSGIKWVICGGESGQQARPMHPDWARSLRDQCQAAGVPFFFKQWGEWKPGMSPRPAKCITDPWMVKVGKKEAGRLLDKREWNEFPHPVTEKEPA